MADELYYVAKNGEAPKMVVGIKAAHEEAQRVFTEKLVPPLEVFESGWNDEWFKGMYGLTIEKVDGGDLVDELGKVQTAYREAASETKRLKSEREQLLLAALVSGNDLDWIMQASEQKIGHIKAFVDSTDLEFPRETHERIEAKFAEMEVATKKKRIIKDGGSNADELQWLEKYKQLKEFDAQRRASKKEHNDEWFGTDCSEDDYEKLKSLVDSYFG